MKEIIKFSRLLRDNNIPASLRSTQTAYEALKLFKDDDAILNEALASVYVKKHSQRAKFDKIFKSVFAGENENSEIPGNQDTGGVKGNKNKRLLSGYNYSFKLIEPSKFKVEPSD